MTTETTIEMSLAIIARKAVLCSKTVVKAVLSSKKVVKIKPQLAELGLATDRQKCTHIYMRTHMLEQCPCFNFL